MAANHVNHVEGALLAGAAKPHIPITKAGKAGEIHRLILLRTQKLFAEGACLPVLSGMLL
jgi:hypothetical protein